MSDWHEKVPRWKYRTTKPITVTLPLPVPGLRPAGVSSRTYALGGMMAAPFIRMVSDRQMEISSGYAWDGASGAIDTKTLRLPSLIHDILYQLGRRGIFGDRVLADKILYKMCLNEGMSRPRAWWIYRAVRAFGVKRFHP